MLNELMNNKIFIANELNEITFRPCVRESLIVSPKTAPVKSFFRLKNFKFKVAGLNENCK